MSTTAVRPLRADAVRNRALIVDAARKLFAERGLDVTLHDVAEEAGVGVGTVYRRFPDKDALLAGLVTAKYETLVELAEQAAALPTGREGLRQYLLGAMQLRSSDRSLSTAVMRAAPQTAEALELRERLWALMGGVVARAQAEGAVRQGFTPDDVPAVSSMIGSIADRTRDEHPDAWRRYALLLVDAVCPPAGELPPLVGEPLAPPPAGCAVARP
ncbi:TetR/AcrR family transcriptional regulator [Kineococcus rhizosphaerae]|uniref:TetR family transcriptional regulator n=1 Tax=Kineococcus rhizosphaerae TaxID=559628 RepID=A0A2T0R697_9ACTN|nr:TetR/AcrR family transcriptional regulator [Kineococcus rhizosphaerae]PRY16671.1 TetR family transcriptional regulator [Kineococcus rhizosphaerae]